MKKLKRVYEAPKLMQSMVVRKPVVTELLQVSMGPPGTATLALYLKLGPPTVVTLSVGGSVTADWDLTIAPDLTQ